VAKRFEYPTTAEENGCEGSKGVAVPQGGSHRLALVALLSCERQQRKRAEVDGSLHELDQAVIMRADAWNRLTYIRVRTGGALPRRVGSVGVPWCRNAAVIQA
jgi:hypothetical protein